MIKFVIISDTHGRVIDNLPIGDILIHCGDWSGRGTYQDTLKFLDWMCDIRKNYKHIVCVPGNHEKFIQENIVLAKEQFNLKDLILLVDEQIELEGVKFYGHPWTPIFHNWAYNADDKKRKRLLKKIPKDTNILITHGPPFGILDKLDEYGSVPGLNVGCKELKNLLGNTNFDLLCCGHIHNQSGIIKYNDTLVVNAASLNEKYEIEDAYKVIYFKKEIK